MYAWQGNKGGNMKFRLLVLVIVTVGLLSSCGISEERSGGTLTENNNGMNDDVITVNSGNTGATELGNNIFISCELPDYQSIKLFDASLGMGTNIDLLSLFKSKPDVKQDPQSGYIQFSCGSEKGALSNETGFGYYCTEEGNKLDSWAGQLSNDVHFFDEYKFTDENFFMSIENAKENILSALTNMGIGECSLELYPVTEEIFNFYCDYYDENLMMDQNDRNSEDLFGKYEEFYFVKGRFLINDVPIFDNDAGNIDNGSAIFGSSFRAIYTDNGLEAIWIINHYEVKKITSEDCQILSNEEILNQLKSVIENSFLTDPITINKINLVYIPIPQNSLEELYTEYIMTPAWEFTDENGDNWYINAITGQEVV